VATRLALAAPAGTDSATVLCALRQLLVAHGVLTGETVRRSALSLIGEAPAVVAAKLEDAFGAAAGGLLELCDAGALADAPQTARTLAATIAATPASTSVAIVGLPCEMHALLEASPGLAACFPQMLQLSELTAAEVARLVASRAVSDFDLALAAGVESQLAASDLTRQSAHCRLRNGALADSLLQVAVGRFAMRIVGVSGSGASASGGAGSDHDGSKLTAMDFGLVGNAAKGGEDASPGSSPISVP